jgi:hypothetical protein
VRQEDVDSGYRFDSRLQRPASSLNRFWLRDCVFGPQSDDDQDERIQLIGGRLSHSVLVQLSNSKNDGSEKCAAHRTFYIDSE